MSDTCKTCGGVLAFLHDHKPDQSGLDDGPWLPERAPRKKMEPKPPEVVREIRLRAWATRRAREHQPQPEHEVM
jgi:hypothetical protein